tara:strand:+ start:508 stop:864 length:357 start_codon:yes stop_codon:yes gene_type:complete
MHIIRTWEALADWLRTCPDPDLTKLLRSRRDQLMEVGLLEDVGVFVIAEAGDSLSALEQALGIIIVTDGAPAWEWVMRHGSTFEAPIILSDDGFGHVLIVPEADEIDPVLLALCRAYA